MTNYCMISRLGLWKMRGMINARIDQFLENATRDKFSHGASLSLFSDCHSLHEKCKQKYGKLLVLPNLGLDNDLILWRGGYTCINPRPCSYRSLCLHERDGRSSELAFLRANLSRCIFVCDEFRSESRTI